MNIEQIVVLLIAERDRLARAIEALCGPDTPAKRRGRPPASGFTLGKPGTGFSTGEVLSLESKSGVGAVAIPSVVKNGERRKRTAADKRAASERMKYYWAAKRKKKSGSAFS